jgi:hypothetical protein
MIFRSWRLFLGHDGRRRHHAHRHDPELAFRLNVHRCHQAAITAPPRPKLSTGYPQTLHPLDNRIELGFPGVGRGPGGSAAARHAAGVLPSLHVALGPARAAASGLSLGRARHEACLASIGQGRDPATISPARLAAGSCPSLLWDVATWARRGGGSTRRALSWCAGFARMG